MDSRVSSVCLLYLPETIQSKYLKIEKRNDTTAYIWLWSKIWLLVVRIWRTMFYPIIFFNSIYVLLCNWLVIKFRCNFGKSRIFADIIVARSRYVDTDTIIYRFRIRQVTIIFFHIGIITKMSH